MANPLFRVEIIKKLFTHRSLLAGLTRIPFLRVIEERLITEGDEPYYPPLEKRCQWTSKSPQDQSIVLPSAIADYFEKRRGYRFLMISASAWRQRAVWLSRDLGCLFLEEVPGESIPG